jgi:Holliday junction resolvase RusA-like endonuclease
MRINIKPLSQNQAWQGRRYKTPAYKSYERECLYRLKPINVPDGKLQINYTVGYSNPMSDIDNFLKSFQDILCKRYAFDDNRIYRIEIEKVITKKGAEFIDFEIKEYTI